MFSKHIDICVEACLQELRNSKDKDIKKAMTKVDKITINEFGKEAFDAMLLDVLGMIISEGIRDEEDEKEMLLYSLEFFMEEIQKMRTLYTFKIALVGLENELNRTLQIPSSHTLADLGYFILASMRASGNHMFDFNINKQRFGNDAQVHFENFEDNIEAASDYELFDLELKENTNFTLRYDYGDNFEFVVTLQDIIIDEQYNPSLDKLVLEGKGYSIWEDAHYEMDLYYHDQKGFEAFLKENKIDKKEYPLTEEFDLEACDEHLRNDYTALKHAYEFIEDEEDRESLLM